MFAYLSSCDQWARCLKSTVFYMTLSGRLYAVLLKNCIVRLKLFGNMQEVELSLVPTSI